jgi:hypothetical protein
MNISQQMVIMRLGYPAIIRPMMKEGEDKLEAMFRAIDPCASGDGGYSVLVYYTYTYAERSDGLVPVNRTRWNSYEGVQNNPSGNGSDIRQGNVCFDGTGEADGGYNNAELRNMNRNYGEQFNNTGTGTASRPGRFGKDWILYWIDR